MRRFSLLVKAVSLAAVLLVLMMGLSMIGGLANERVAYRAQAAASVRESLAGQQVLAGAAMSRHCTTTVESRVERDKKVVTERHDEQVVLKSLPQSAVWTATSMLEPRYRGLYKVNSFNLDAKGDIEWTAGTDLVAPVVAAPVVAVRCDLPRVEFAVSDARGVRGIKVIGPKGAENVVASTNGEFFKTGFEAAIDLDDATLQKPFRIQLDVQLVGTEALGFVALGHENTVSLTSDWAHPSFSGAFLPMTRSASDKGFQAKWSVSSLASNARGQIGKNASVCAENIGLSRQGGQCLQSFGVDFIDPVNPASLSDRATKYGILFIVLTFAGIVLLEVLKGQAVHPVQYLLIGAAMAVFFLLLLSLSEHIAFIKAYVTAAVACVALLTVYAKAVLGGWQRALPMSAGLAVLYCVLYLVLQSEQHALLAGSLLVFAVLAGVMLLTRHVKWGGLNEGA
ncbi:MAG: cell envelope integrity protein CreD [Burkholderiales bacterium]